MKRTTIKPLRFDEHTFVDLVGMVYKVFPQEEDRRRTASMYLETFYCVLPLLVETCGRLLPPLEMLSSSCKAAPWSAKEALYSSKLSQIRVATFTSM